MSATQHVPVVVADKAVDEEAWKDARAEGVTASEVHALAQGGVGTRRRILDDKLNGSTFHGNQHTMRGHEREDVIAEWVERKFGPAPCSLLIAHPVHTSHRASPDGLGRMHARLGGRAAGVEVKSHAFGYVDKGIPGDHYDQMQWGMHVSGVDQWLYVTETLEADGYAPEEPTVVIVPRDEARIAQLVEAADAFLAWREAGAPDVDPDVSEELDDAIAQHVEARARKDAAAADEKAAEQVIRAFIKEHGDEKVAVKRSGTVGGFAFTSKLETTTLDWAAWEAADPEVVAEHRAAREALTAAIADVAEAWNARRDPELAAFAPLAAELDDIEAEQIKTYKVDNYKTRLAIAAHKKEAAA